MKKIYILCISASGTDNQFYVDQVQKYIYFQKNIHRWVFLGGGGGCESPFSQLLPRNLKEP